MIEPFADKMKIAFGKHDVDSSSVFQAYIDGFGLKISITQTIMGRFILPVLSSVIPFRIGSPQYDFARADLKSVERSSDRLARSVLSQASIH